MTNIVGKTGVEIPSANAVRSITLPNVKGLIGEYWLGGTQAESIKNRVAEGAAMTVLGTPVYSAGSVEVRAGADSGDSYGFDTGLAAPDAVTMITLAKNPTAGGVGPVFASGYTGIGGVGGIFGHWAFWNGQIAGPTDQARVPYAADDDPFYFVAGSGLIGSIGKVYLFEDDAMTTDFGTATTVSRGSATVRFGGFIDANAQTQNEVAYGAIFQGIKSEAFIEDAYVSLKAWAADRGITVS